MAYCMIYHPKLKDLVDKMDEICIKYNPKDGSLGRFVQEHPDKRFIIWVEEPASFTADDLTKIVQIHSANPDIPIAIKISYKNAELAETLLTDSQEAGIPAFFDIVARDWDTLNGLIDLHVSDIYIGEDLGFDLVQVSSIAKSAGVKLRTFPNICQTSWKKTDPLKTFFIRPEDAEFYSKYIDCYEFFTTTQPIATLYRIYAIDKKWFGDLNELIIGFNSSLDSRGVLDTFAEKRVKCRKKCVQGRGCLMCERCAELAQTMNEHSLYFKH